MLSYLTIYVRHVSCWVEGKYLLYHTQAKTGGIDTTV